MSAFQGFPQDLFTLFTELETDNSKAFWQANKGRWEQDVRAPMHALLTELSREFGPLRMFRPNRDVRLLRNSCVDSAPHWMTIRAAGNSSSSTAPSQQGRIPSRTALSNR